MAVSAIGVFMCACVCMRVRVHVHVWVWVWVWVCGCGWVWVWVCMCVSVGVGCGVNSTCVCSLLLTTLTSGASTLAADGMLDADAEGGWGDDADLMLDEGQPLYCTLLSTLFPLPVSHALYTAHRVQHGLTSPSIVRTIKTFPASSTWSEHI